MSDHGTSPWHLGIPGIQWTIIITTQEPFVSASPAQMKEFPGYAQVRRITATLEPWTVENGLLTPTLKLRRSRVMEKFQAELDGMYTGH